MTPVELQLSESLQKGPIEPFASDSDYQECRRLHKKHGSTYYFASSFLPIDIRRRVHALYGFVRLADELVDNPTPGSDPSALIREYRREFLRGVEGVTPKEPVLRAFCDVARESGIPIEEPLAFLDSMELDEGAVRYRTYGELRSYMRGSACAVGVMMCHLLDAPLDEETLASARALGEAMQLTNFIRDVAEDGRRGRIYLPMEDLRTFEVTEQEIFQQTVSERFQSLLRFEISRARALYAISDAGILRLPSEVRKPVRIARLLYARILDRIERMGCNVFEARARTTWWEKVGVAAHVGFGG